MKITSRLVLMISVIFCLSLSGTVLVFVQLGNMSDDGRVVNYAGIVRGATQRLVKLEASGKPADELIAKLDKIVQGLMDGDRELRLPKADDPAFLAGMKDVAVAWAGVKTSIAEARRNRALAPDLLAASEKHFELANKAVSAAEHASTGHVAATKRNMVFVILVIAGVCAAVAWMAVKYITRPIFAIGERLHAITKGDLTVKIDYNKGDEISRLGQDVQKLAEAFDNSLRGMLQTSNNVVHGLDQVRVKSRKTLEDAKGQTGQAKQISAAVEEMGQTITDIARNASSAAETANQAMNTARTGKEVADGAVDTVNKVHASTDELSSMIGKLTDRTSEIGGIVTVIKGIADQTNMLALNAAIEAARAGEQGRGFAVVADEVRKLAERTIAATAEISGKITSVQEEVSRTARSMTEASGEVTTATKYIQEVGEALASIVESVQLADDQITRIATAIEELSTVSEEVVNNIGQTHSTTLAMENTAFENMREVNSLIATAEELRTTTSGFRISDADQLMFDLARTDHRLYVGKIAAHLNGDLKLDSAALPDHHSCRFGKWYDDDGQRTCGTTPSLRAVDAPHQRIHALGKEVVLAYDRGDTDGAMEKYKEIEKHTDHICSLLEQAKNECYLT